MVDIGPYLHEWGTASEEESLPLELLDQPPEVVAKFLAAETTAIAASQTDAVDVDQAGSTSNSPIREPISVPLPLLRNSLTY